MQERVEEAQVLLELGLLVGGVGLAGEDLEVAANRRSAVDAGRPASSGVTPVGGGHDDGVVGAGLGEHRLGGGVVGGDQGGAGEAVDVAEAWRCRRG